jgi:hypothetical protein
MKREKCFWSWYMKEGGEILMEREGRGERGGGDEEGS